MRYVPRGTSNDRARSRVLAATPRKRAVSSFGRSPSTNSASSPRWFDRPLQAVAPQYVVNNAILDTSYGMGILLCKTADRGGGGRDLLLRRRRRRISPLRLFFANWPPFALAHHRRHAIVHLVVSSSHKGIARYACISVAGFLFPRLARYTALVYRWCHYDNQVHTKRENG